MGTGWWEQGLGSPALARPAVPSPAEPWTARAVRGKVLPSRQKWVPSLGGLLSRREGEARAEGKAGAIGQFSAFALGPQPCLIARALPYRPSFAFAGRVGAFSGGPWEGKRFFGKGSGRLWPIAYEKALGHTWVCTVRARRTPNRAKSRTPHCARTPCTPQGCGAH